MEQSHYDSDDETDIEQQPTIAELSATIKQQDIDLTRLRKSRDLHRTNTKTLSIKNDESTNRVQELEEHIRDTQFDVKVDTQEVEFLDSDVEDAEQPIKLKAPPSATPRTPSPDVAVNKDRDVGAGNNKRYPDVPEFHSTKDSWDRRRLHLASKFRQSAMLFPTENDKIEYIRDHCKPTTFDVMRALANLRSDDPYTTAEEMIEELHSIFGEYYVRSVNEARLYAPDFPMGVTREETFHEFYPRFSSTLAPLGYPELQKISFLRRPFTSRLPYQITTGAKETLYTQIVNRLRQCDLDLRIQDARRSDQEGSRSKGHVAMVAMVVATTLLSTLITSR